MSASTGGGAPKIKKNASRKNKKSWRKNVDMSAVEEYLEEKRFDERIGKIIFSFMSRERYREKTFCYKTFFSLVFFIACLPSVFSSVSVNVVDPDLYVLDLPDPNPSLVVRIRDLPSSS
jgi:hypothetical protein